MAGIFPKAPKPNTRSVPKRRTPKTPASTSAPPISGGWMEPRRVVVNAPLPLTQGFGSRLHVGEQTSRAIPPSGGAQHRPSGCSLSAGPQRHGRCDRLFGEDLWRRRHMERLPVQSKSTHPCSKGSTSFHLSSPAFGSFESSERSPERMHPKMYFG